MNGKPLARVLPAQSPLDEWNDAKAARRSMLIDREIDGTISPDESLELELLQDALQVHVEKTAPLPMEYAKTLLRGLLAKADAASRT